MGVRLTIGSPSKELDWRIMEQANLDWVARALSANLLILDSWSIFAAMHGSLKRNYDNENGANISQVRVFSPSSSICLLR